ncbi:hypothetical protein [Pseudozobellia thermophila]|uniref:Uncharacterized protein n=1 Tax=Pseudozobellia thermophila TaxID=192903 RepID=A0A1M6PJN0_9FLAO|nr:hypothetical protein [Pseudozobellia thermophila]SHK08137.1 hypothetical protein SAMN04488513_1241 [Pseudozobellia thermophila]
MKKSLFISLLLLVQVFPVNGQSDSIVLIQRTVDKIENDANLTIKEFDATEVYKQAFDGGGKIELYVDKKGLRKIEQEIGVSFGRLTTVVYFENGQPIKLIDREENFKWLEDQTGWDYSELNKVFQADIYIFDWELDNNKTIEEGKRNLSEGSCAVFEYEPFIELGKELTNK